MDIAPTSENRALASAVNARLRSDSRILNAKSAMWRAIGAGILCALAGVGIGAAFYGYSYARDPVPPAERMATIIATALDRVADKFPKAEPPAAAPATPKPTAEQLGTDAAPASKAAVATNFTVFKNVPFNAGQVVTGWNFASSSQSQPNHQYCYYSEQIDVTSKVTIDLGENGRALPQSKTRANVDPVQAYQSCVWFKSGSL